ncbi:MAG: TetR/AcrR family transcriptional regulator [Bacteroides sp.]|nr:TetR/AcrR family transcriptional regulator [Bacteroides sp.]
MEKENGKNRHTTEQLLLQAVKEIIEENGFEKLGINAVATKAGVSKMLIYRYFSSLEGLIAAYISQNDYWINFPIPLPEKEGLNSFLKEMFRMQIASLRSSYTLRRLYRWELSESNKFVRDLRGRREEKGKELVRIVSRLTGRPEKEVAVMATLLTASLSYLALLEEQCETYNGIPIQRPEGWVQLEEEINRMIDNWIDQKQNDE